LIKLCIKCMCRYVLIVQCGYLILKLSPVHMKEVIRTYILLLITNYVYKLLKTLKH